MLNHRLCIFVLALSTASISHAEIEPILTVGVEVGGDDLVTTTTTDLKAGGGITFGAGASISPTDSSVSFRVVIHYLFDTVDFTSPNGEAESDSFPLEFSIFNSWDRHELGAGVTSHLNSSHEICFDSGGCSEIDFDNSTGVFLQYNYIFSRAETASMTTDTYIGLKIKTMDYEYNNVTIDANSVGLYLGAKF